MTERRSAVSVRVWAFLFALLLIILVAFFLRLFVEEPDGGPASAAPYQQPSGSSQ